MVGLLIINQTFWRLLRFTIILLLLRTHHSCPLTLPRNSPINQCLVHFTVTLSTWTALFLRYSVELRVVHDLSFPEGLSVNDGISSDYYLEQFCKLSLPGIDRLVEFVNAKGRGCHVFKKIYGEFIVKSPSTRRITLC